MFLLAAVLDQTNSLSPFAIPTCSHGNVLSRLLCACLTPLTFHFHNMRQLQSTLHTTPTRLLHISCHLHIYKHLNIINVQVSLSNEKTKVNEFQKKRRDSFFTLYTLYTLIEIHLQTTLVSSIPLTLFLDGFLKPL